MRTTTLFATAALLAVSSMAFAVEPVAAPMADPAPVAASKTEAPVIKAMDGKHTMHKKAHKHHVKKDMAHKKAST